MKNNSKSYFNSKLNMEFKIYHNPRCKKSRAGLAYLSTKTDKFELVEYLKTGISIEEIENIIKLTGLKVSDLIRTQEEIYKKELKGKSNSVDYLIKFISENPKLLQRPVVLKDNEAVIGDPPENIDSLFK